MPPPSLSSTTTTSLRPSREAASRPPMSCASATSPISATTGPRAAAATPNAVETVPSIPLAPRLASTRGGSGRAGKNVSTSRTGIEDATTSVAAAGRGTPSPGAARRGGRQAHAELGSDARLGQPLGPEHGRDRLRRGVVGALPVLEPALGARLARQALGESVERAARVRRGDRRHRAGGILPRGLGVEADLQRAAEAGQPLAQRL